MQNPEWGRGYTGQPAAGPLDGGAWECRLEGFFVGLALGLILMAWIHRGGK